MSTTTRKQKVFWTFDEFSRVGQQFTTPKLMFLSGKAAMDAAQKQVLPASRHKCLTNRIIQQLCNYKQWLLTGRAQQLGIDPGTTKFFIPSLNNERVNGMNGMNGSRQPLNLVLKEQTQRLPSKHTAITVAPAEVQDNFEVEIKIIRFSGTMTQLKEVLRGL